MGCIVNLSSEFLDDFQQSSETAVRNLADLTTVEMKKLAPFARPSQYKYGYPGTPGNLVRSIQRSGSGLNTLIKSSAPYAIVRNYENNLNPQTKHYIERAINNVLNSKSSQWWRA